jgi:hypothetical protein
MCAKSKGAEQDTKEEGFEARWIVFNRLHSPICVYLLTLSILVSIMN